MQGFHGRSHFRSHLGYFHVLLYAYVIEPLCLFVEKGILSSTIHNVFSTCSIDKEPRKRWRLTFGCEWHFRSHLAKFTFYAMLVTLCDMFGGWSHFRSHLANFTFYVMLVTFCDKYQLLMSTCLRVLLNINILLKFCWILIFCWSSAEY